MRDGPSGGGGSSGRPWGSSARWRAAPTPWRAPSTGSARPWRRAATSRIRHGGHRARRAAPAALHREDLLAAECLRHHVWKRLDAPGLAAAVSALVHKPSHEEAEVSPRMPTDDVAEAVTAMERLWSEIEDLEVEHDLPTTSMPDGGMAWMVHRWASGERLDAVLRGQDMAAGASSGAAATPSTCSTRSRRRRPTVSCAARPARRSTRSCAESSPPTAWTDSPFHPGRPNASATHPDSVRRDRGFCGRRLENRSHVAR